MRDGVSAPAVYPTERAARDRFVLERRGPRRLVDPWAPPRVAVDPEPDGAGGVVDVATLFLSGRECPWRCVMCDLWRDTVETDTPPGAIPHQIRSALAPQAGLRAGPRFGTGPTNLKLYNAGSFFDPRAVPPQDDSAIADAIADAQRVTVESHPRLVGDRTWRFRDRLAPALDVAMGLETAHPDALARLNKGCTVDDFAAAAAALAAHGVGLRVFLLVHPPFVPRDERSEWLRRSIDVAVGAGASVIALIPTRGDTGAMPALAELGEFAPPTLADLEAAAASALRSAQSRVRILADLWDLALFASCADCLDARRGRLLRQNLEQRVPEPVACATCGAPGTCR
jgi:archaeosine synthase beta-subunit